MRSSGRCQAAGVEVTMGAGVELAASFRLCWSSCAADTSWYTGGVGEM